MWLVKGLGLGLVLFAVFFVVYFVTVIAGGIRPHVAIGLSAITGSTIHKPLFWLAFLLTLSACCTYAKLLTR
jgi:hypothetical protein